MENGKINLEEWLRENEAMERVIERNFSKKKESKDLYKNQKLEDIKTEVLNVLNKIKKD